MSDGAKLQLLSRSTDESSFEIFEADSIAAYRGLKPRRPPADSYELRRQPVGIDGARQFVLKSLRRDCYLLLDVREHFLWEHFDGRSSLEEIARAFHLQYGAFDYNVIREFLATLDQAELIEIHPALALHGNFVRSDERASLQKRVKAAATAWRRLTLKLPQADRYCSTLYRRGGFLLFHRASFWMILAVALLGGIGCFQLAAQSAGFAGLLAARPYASTVFLLLAHLGALMLHVLVHALACKAHGRRVHELGFFLLQGVWPAFYADVTDIFMSDRRARLIVDLAGPLVEVCLGSLAMLAAYACPAGFEQALFFAIGVLLWESALINLYPFSFLELDGYNMLADAIAMPMLRRQALALLPNLPERLRNRRTWTRAELIQTGYLALCFISVVVYVVLHLDALAALVTFNRS